MKYKVGDEFPVKWDKTLIEEDEDFYISGEVTINEEKTYVEVAVSCILESTISIPPLPNEGLVEIIEIEEYGYVLRPIEWLDSGILAEILEHLDDEESFE